MKFYLQLDDTNITNLHRQIYKSIMITSRDIKTIFYRPWSYQTGLYIYLHIGKCSSKPKILQKYILDVWDKLRLL